MKKKLFILLAFSILIYSSCVNDLTSPYGPAVWIEPSYGLAINWNNYYLDRVIHPEAVLHGIQPHAVGEVPGDSAKP